MKRTRMTDLRDKQDTYAILKQQILRYEPALWLFFVLLPLACVWSFEYLPSQDSFAHLYTVRLLDWYLFSPGQFSDIFVSAIQPVPNWVSQIFLLITGKLMGLDLAYRLLLTGNMVLLPLVLSWNLMKEGEWLKSWLIFPLILNHPLFFGFYNYVLGIIVFLALCGLLVRAPDKPAGLSWLYFSCLCLLCYFCHPIAAGLSFFAVLVRFRKSLLSMWLPIMLTLAPLSLMLLWYVAQSSVTKMFWQDHVLTLSQILLFASLFPFSRNLEPSVIFWVPSLLIIFLAGLTQIKAGINEYTKFFLILCGFSIILCFAMPDQIASGSIIQYRLTILPWLFICLALKTKHKLLLIALASLSLWVYAAQNLSFYQTCCITQPVYKEFHEAMSLPPENSIVLNLNEDFFGKSQNGKTMGGRVGVFEHAHSVCALAEKRLVLLNHYQANTKAFPFVFADVVPLSKFRSRPELLSAWESDKGIQIDYLIIHGVKKDILPPDWQKLFKPDPGWIAGKWISVWTRKK